MEKRKIDWPSVDWSKTNTAIARESGCSQPNVSKMRKKYGRRPEEQAETKPEKEPEVTANNVQEVSAARDGDPHSDDLLSSEREKRSTRKSQSYAHSIAAATDRANPEKVAEITALIGKMYKAVDVATALGVTVRAVQGYLKRGIMGGRKIGGDWIITEENLRRFVEGLPPKKDDGGAGR